MEEIGNLRKVFMNSLFNPFKLSTKKEKLNKYNMFVDTFIKNTQNFFNELDNYLENNTIVFNNFKTKLISFQNEYNLYMFRFDCYYYMSSKNSAMTATNLKTVMKELKPLYKKTKELTPKLDELCNLLKHEQMGLALPNNTSKSNSEIINSLRNRYSKLTSEIYNIYIINGIQENQIELMTL